MPINRFLSLAIAILVFSSITIEDANAITVDCRVRDKPRSEITVQAGNFTNWLKKPAKGKKKGKKRRKFQVQYYAVVYSGGSAPASSVAKVQDANLQLEYYFDSNASDIRPGDTLIPPNFIATNKVTVDIREVVSGNVVAKAIDVPCRVD
jgi:hypothetical protein